MWPNPLCLTSAGETVLAETMARKGCPCQQRHQGSSGRKPTQPSGCQELGEGSFQELLAARRCKELLGCTGTMHPLPSQSLESRGKGG